MTRPKKSKAKRSRAFACHLQGSGVYVSGFCTRKEQDDALEAYNDWFMNGVKHLVQIGDLTISSANIAALEFWDPEAVEEPEA